MAATSLPAARHSATVIEAQIGEPLLHRSQPPSTPCDLETAEMNVSPYHPTTERGVTPAPRLTSRGGALATESALSAGHDYPSGNIAPVLRQRGLP